MNTKIEVLLFYLKSVLEYSFPNIKFHKLVESIHSEKTLSHILYIRPSFYFMKSTKIMRIINKKCGCDH